MSQRALSEKCFGNENQHSRLCTYEKGKKLPDLETVSTILKALGSSYADLEQVSLEEKLVLTFTEVTEALQITEPDLRQLVKRRLIKPLYFGTRPRFSRVEVNRFIGDSTGETIHLYSKRPS